MNLCNQFLQSAKLQFVYYKTLGEKAIEQLEQDQLFVSFNEESNSIATIVKHLWGNMMSRWTDLFSSDGEKPWRNRDAEFVNDLNSKDEVLKLWNEGWDCLFGALDSLQPEQLGQIVYIRNQGHTVMDAINRQLCHYAYHVGQMIYAAKLLKKGEWNSLSIPRNQSLQYNHEKFSREKKIIHFTVEEQKRLSDDNS